MRTGVNRRILERVLLAITLVVVLGPIIWGFLLSFEGNREIRASYPIFFPSMLHWENYATVMANSSWLQGMKNSFLIAFTSTAINILLSVPFAFAMARLKFPGKRWMRRLVLAFVFMPIMFFFLPIKEAFSHYGLENTIWATALPIAAQLFPALTLTRFYSELPTELDDYASIQGLTPFRTMVKIYLPLSAKPITYTAMLNFITVWNCCFLPMFMYHGANRLMTIQQSLLSFALHPDSIQIAMAAVILTCLPCWLLFFTQYRYAKIMHISMVDPFKR